MSIKERPNHLLYIRTLQRMSPEKLDHEYLCEWTLKLGIESEMEKLKAEAIAE